MAHVLYDLQKVLFESVFDTIEAFIVLYSKCHSNEVGQAETAFQCFILENKKKDTTESFHFALTF